MGCHYFCRLTDILVINLKSKLMAVHHYSSGVLWVIVLFFGLVVSCNFSKRPDLVDTSSSDGKAESDSTKKITDSLVNLSVANLFSNPDSSQFYAGQVLEMARENGNKSHEMKILSILGISYYIQTNYRDALDYFLKSLELAIELRDTANIASAYNHIGMIQHKSGNLKASYDAHYQALKLYEQIGDAKNRSVVLNNLGFMYGNINNYDKAFDYFRQSYELAIQSEDIRNIATSLSNLGFIHSLSGSIDSAFTYMNKAVALLKSTSNDYSLGSFYLDKAKIHFQVKEYDSAYYYYWESERISTEINSIFQKTEANIGLAETCLEINKITEGIKFAEIALRTAEDLNSADLKQKSHDILAKAYERDGDCNMSMIHFKASGELKDAINNQTKLHELYNTEIQILSQETEIKQLEIERQELLLNRKNNAMLAILIGTAFLLIGGLLIYRNLRYRQQVAHSVEIMRLTEQKSRAAIESEIHERKRIGQELHDGLGQLLSVAMINISILQQKSSLTENRRKELLDAAILGVDKAFNELRSISHNLAPPALTAKGFSAALQELIDQVNETGYMKVNLDIYGFNGSFDSLIENTLYRAIQELISNALKHAKAENVDIQLIKNESEITLMVEDDGIGFEVNKVIHTPGGGLDNINSRVENLKGKFFIDSKPDRGTIATIVIPINSILT